MSLAEWSRQNLSTRLDEADRGDRGWWILTRVHVSSYWLKGITQYLERLSEGASFTLNKLDYRRLGTIVQSESNDPGKLLRRHHLLVMDKPLQLLKRQGRSWTDELILTDRGRELACAFDICPVLEDALKEIRFAKAPWCPPDRMKEYSSFDVPVYRVTKQVLRSTNGYIDRDEFDFFLSRIRTVNEVNWAIDSISKYRKLDSKSKKTLHHEVRDRTPSQKSYQNWRDMGLHTFSLFSLGSSMVRSGTQLYLTKKWVRQKSRKESKSRKQNRSPVELRIPELPESEDLLVPPAAPAINDGSFAESFVAKVLRSQGWKVAFYTHRRGYGFDLWACKDEKPMLIEVKSSKEELGTVKLTRLEYLAAKKHRNSYVLAIVEHVGTSSPQMSIVQNPANVKNITKQSRTEYTIARSNWLKHARDS